MKTTSLLSLINQLSELQCDYRQSPQASTLLEILASPEEMNSWAKYHQLSLAELYKTCLNVTSQYIHKNSQNSYCVLLINKGTETTISHYRKHYHLLMKIFHPDKINNIEGLNIMGYSQCSGIIIRAYKDIQHNHCTQDKHLQFDPSPRSKIVLDKMNRKKVLAVQIRKKKKVRSEPSSHLKFYLAFTFLILFIVSYFYLSNIPTVHLYKKEVLSEQKMKVLNDHPNARAKNNSRKIIQHK